MNITKKLMMAAGLFFQLSNLQAMTQNWTDAIQLFGGARNIQPGTLDARFAQKKAARLGTPEAQAIAAYMAGATPKLDVASILAEANAPYTDLMNQLPGSVGGNGRGNSLVSNPAAVGMKKALRDNPAMAAELKEAILARPELAALEKMPAGHDKLQATSAAAAHALSDAIDKMPANEQNQARQAACDIISGSQLSSSSAAATAYSNSNKSLGRLSNNSPKSSPKSSAKSAKMAQGAQAQKTANTAS